MAALKSEEGRRCTIEVVERVEMRCIRQVLAQDAYHKHDASKMYDNDILSQHHDVGQME